jgi:hypothetical protein
MEVAGKSIKTRTEKYFGSLQQNLNMTGLRSGESTIGNKVDQNVLADLLDEFRRSQRVVVSPTSKEMLKPSLVNLN